MTNNEHPAEGTDRAYQYITQMKPVFRQRAVFSDESKYYRTPYECREGDDVTVRIRTMRNNADSVWFISGALREEMRKASSDEGFDYYEFTVRAVSGTVRYYFEIRVGQLTFYYNKLGVTRDLSERNAFRIIPGFSVPGWAEGAVMYQIFTDRFCNGERGNDVRTGEYAYLDGQSVHIDDWYRVPDSFDVRNFYGGDLEGIEQKLDYLQDLGVEVLYLNPIFVSPSNHKYDIQDYDHIDPHLAKIVRDEGRLLAEGEMSNANAENYVCRVADPANLEASDSYFIHFCEEVHRRGMKIILDGVFNHCGSFNKWLDRECIYEKIDGYEKGAYIDADSPYRSFFKFNNEHAWPYNEFYDGWWGHPTLPKLNYEDSGKLVEYIMEIGRKWVSPPYSADGWRLDVAADLGHSSEFNHRFWREFRNAVKEANPEAIILAEHYGETFSWLQGDEWDTVMNYDAFMEPVSWFLTGMEKHSDEFREDLLGNGDSFRDAMAYHQASFSGPSLMCAMNELDNHDHSRFLTRTNHYVGRVGELGAEAAARDVNYAVMRSAVLIQMTFIGAPTIYYGDEAGLPGFTDPDNRRTYPWGMENEDLLAFYRKAVALRKRYPVLRNGSYKDLGSGKNRVLYGRFSPDEQIAVAVNSGDEPLLVEIPVWEMGISRSREIKMRALLTTWKDGYSDEPAGYVAQAGFLTIELRPFETVVLLRRSGPRDGETGE